MITGVLLNVKIKLNIDDEDRENIRKETEEVFKEKFSEFMVAEMQGMFESTDEEVVSAEVEVLHGEEV